MKKSLLNDSKVCLHGETLIILEIIQEKYSFSDLKKLVNQISDDQKQTNEFEWLYTELIRPEFVKWLSENKECSSVDAHDALDAMLLAAKIELVKIIETSDEQKITYIKNSLVLKLLEE